MLISLDDAHSPGHQGPITSPSSRSDPLATTCIALRRFLFAYLHSHRARRGPLASASEPTILADELNRFAYELDTHRALLEGLVDSIGEAAPSEGAKSPTPGLIAQLIGRRPQPATDDVGLTPVEQLIWRVAMQLAASRAPESVLVGCLLRTHLDRSVRLDASRGERLLVLSNALKLEEQHFPDGECHERLLALLTDSHVPDSADFMARLDDTISWLAT